jgi:hypothetical protein
MDPLLQRLVDGKVVRGHKMPWLMLWLAGGVQVLGFIAPDSEMTDDLRGFFAERGFPELADQVGLNEVSEDRRYITLAKVHMWLPPLQEMDLPFLRVDTDRITSWAMRMPPPEPARSEPAD